MKILVTIKRIEDYESKLKVKPDGSWIVTDGVNYKANPFDDIAIEEALRLKAVHGGEIVAISAGGAASQTELRDALATGADRAILVKHDGYLDSDGAARLIAKVAESPASSEDLERVKTQLIAEAIYAQDNQATLARWYGGALTTGLSIEDIRSWPDRIRAVTAEQVQAAAQKWLDKKRSVTGYLIKDTTAKREEKRS